MCVSPAALIKNTDLDFFIDIHAHSTMMNGFMYGNIYEDSNRYERQAIFPKLLCSNADDFSMNSTSFNKDAVKAGTGRRLVVVTVALVFNFHHGLFIQLCYVLFD